MAEFPIWLRILVYLVVGGSALYFVIGIASTIMG